MIEVREGCVVEALLQGEVDVVLHVCNCQGVMGSGVAKVVKEKVPEAYKAYMKSYYNHSEKGDMLGITSQGGGVVNLHAQEYYGYDGKRYLDYGALAQSLTLASSMLVATVPDELTEYLTIAIPYKMGSDRAGGDWQVVQELVQGLLKGYKVVAYKL